MENNYIGVIIYKILNYKKKGKTKMDGPMRYRDVTEAKQNNWRNQHNYKMTTHGNNCHTNIKQTGLGRERKY